MDWNMFLQKLFLKYLEWIFVQSSCRHWVEIIRWVGLAACILGIVISPHPDFMTNIDESVSVGVVMSFINQMVASSLRWSIATRSCTSTVVIFISLPGQSIRTVTESGVLSCVPSWIFLECTGSYLSFRVTIIAGLWTTSNQNQTCNSLCHTVAGIVRPTIIASFVTVLIFSDLKCSMWRFHWCLK